MTPDQMYKVGNSLLTNPDQWRTDDIHTIRHVPSGFELWVSSGPSFYRSWSTREETSVVFWWLRPHYRFLHKAVQQYRIYQTEKCLDRIT